MFRNQFILSKSIKGLQHGLSTSLIIAPIVMLIAPIVMRLHDYYIPRSIKKDTIDKWSRLTHKLVKHDKERIKTEIKNTKQQELANKALAAKQQAHLEEQLKIIQKKEAIKERQGKERTENIKTAYQLIADFCDHVSNKANQERYTQGKSNDHTKFINQHWFENKEMQPLLPEAFRAITNHKPKRRATRQANIQPKSDADIKRLLDTIENKLTMLSNSPIDIEEIDQQFTQLKEGIHTLFNDDVLSVTNPTPAPR